MTTKSSASSSSSLVNQLLRDDETTAVFIDGMNLYSASKALEFNLDYRKILDLFNSRGRMIRAFYYTAIVEQEGSSSSESGGPGYTPIKPLVDWLEYNGYTTRTKIAKDHIDQNGRRRIKGNMDIELAIDMLEISEHIDHAILFSGDGDFKKLVETVQRKGVRVTIISTLRSPSPMVSDDLRRQADCFFDLIDLIPLISRQPERPRVD